MNDNILFLEEIKAEAQRRESSQRLTSLYHKILGRRNFREIIRNGIRWKVRHMAAERHIVKLGAGGYEPEQVTYFFTQAQSRKCDVFLDLGANIGYYSMFAVKMGMFEQIHAIEPSAGNFERLQWHLQENGFADKVRTYQMAVSDSCGKIRVSEENAENSVAIKVVDSDEAGVEVDCATLDSLFNFRGQGLAIKMDIEGHEISAFQGAKKLFANNDIFLQVEIWRHKPDAMNYLLAEGFELIRFYQGDFYFTRKKMQ